MCSYSLSLSLSVWQFYNFSTTPIKNILKKKKQNCVEAVLHRRKPFYSISWVSLDQGFYLLRSDKFKFFLTKIHCQHIQKCKCNIEDLKRIFLVLSHSSILYLTFYFSFSELHLCTMIAKYSSIKVRKM